MREKNLIILGYPGFGKASHPWDNLNTCSCGYKAFIYGNKGIFENGYPFHIECLGCRKKTKEGSLSEIMNEWNKISKDTSK